MKFGQLTIDEVHQDLAREVAGLCGVEVETIEPRDLPLRTPCDAAIVDWDYLGRGRGDLLKHLLTSLPKHAIALHTYDIDEQEYLRALGFAAVFPCLDADVFRALLAAIRPQAA
ncbi:MAG TPA: hypothetical protein VEL76_25620 [Gemmataceae bacterium]|nr:hypothetical protein [Gemmataceae bacterium]